MQLRSREPAVARDSPPELELELRMDEAENLLGGGAFGAVWVARRRGVRVAAKMFHAIANPHMYGLDDNPASLQTILDEVMQEVNALVAVDHTHIIHFAGVAYSTRNGHTLPKWILSEHAAGGTLHARIYCEQPLAESLMVRYTKEVVSGLAYLHDNVNMIHCDMKPKNILLSIDDRIKIADLGITRVLQRIDSLTNRGTMTMCGTPIYLAPECAMGAAFTASRDIYAWGLILCEMALEEEPPSYDGMAPSFHGHAWYVDRARRAAAERAAAERDRRREETTSAGAGLQQLMVNCTKAAAHERPTAAQVLTTLTQTAPSAQQAQTFAFGGGPARGPAPLFGDGGRGGGRGGGPVPAFGGGGGGGGFVFGPPASGGGPAPSFDGGPAPTFGGGPAPAFGGGPAPAFGGGGGFAMGSAGPPAAGRAIHKFKRP